MRRFGGFALVMAAALALAACSGSGSSSSAASQSSYQYNSARDGGALGPGTHDQNRE
jgi:ABC-type glycerol-3-phosphate transport system substrate-binding protein